jgi:hypothetical protein
MPTTCEGCRYYAPADTAGPCPECGRPLKFTLLPPPGADPDPLPLGEAEADRPVRRWERDAAGPRRPWLYNLVTDVRFLAVVGVAAFVLLLAKLWVEVARASGDPDFAPK